jgi:hypothetical protein
MKDLAARLQALPQLSTSELRGLWPEAFGRPAPEQLRRELMVRILGYRLQERALGGLSRDAERRVAQLQAAFGKDRNPPLTSGPTIKAGTRLIRSWKGDVHQVTVAQNGYEYKNRRYGSLSEIARLITGTRWNGPLFFGLRNGHAKERTDVA